MYQPRCPSLSRLLPIRGLDYHLRCWGEPGAGQPPLLLLHGWMDVSASFQFMVDALQAERWVLAPDWRGFGPTDSRGADSFWFPDYLADLDALLDQLGIEQPIDLVGHSMGGNLAMLYAGVRPERIRRLVNLEGFGMPATRAAQAPQRMTQWLDQLRQHRRGALRLRPYPSVQAVAERLQATNPRLAADKALWLAQHWAAERAPGQWQVLGEAAHKIVNAQLYRVDETLAIHAQITAPVLMVEAEDNGLAHWWKGQLTLAEHHERLRVVPRVERVTLADCGHMLHHDQPQALAALIERFLESS